MDFKSEVYEAFKITLSENQIELFEKYYSFLIEYNKKVNLTRITEKTEVYFKHFFDSLTPIKQIDFQTIETLCDMGAGAGFPSIPLKIVFPHLKITIIDALGKRIKFLEELTNKLQITGVTLIHDRIEIAAKVLQSKFDLVTSRALAHTRTVLEFGVPMTKVGGINILMKSTNFQEEIDLSQAALKKLSVKIIKIDSFDLPNNYGFRANLYIQKTKHIEGYPRTYQQIIKNPL